MEYLISKVPLHWSSSVIENVPKTLQCNYHSIVLMYRLDTVK